MCLKITLLGKILPQKISKDRGSYIVLSRTPPSKWSFNILILLLKFHPASSLKKFPYPTSRLNI